MIQPPGYSDGTSGVFKLNKALYGPKQARVWFKELSSTLSEVIDKVNDTIGLFVKCQHQTLCQFVVYVNHIHIISSD